MNNATGESYMPANPRGASSMKESSTAAKSRSRGREAGKQRSKHKADFQTGDVLAGMHVNVRFNEIVFPVLRHLTTSQQNLYQCIHGLLNSERGDDRHSLKVLADDKHLNWRERSVKQAASDLKKLGLISRKQSGQHGVVTRMLMPPAELLADDANQAGMAATATPDLDSRGGENAVRGGENATSGVAVSATQTRKGTRKEPGTAARGTRTHARRNGPAKSVRSNRSAGGTRVLRVNGKPVNGSSSHDNNLYAQTEDQEDRSNRSPLELLSPEELARLAADAVKNHKLHTGVNGHGGKP